MRAKLGSAGLLAALAVAALPGVSSAGWCAGLTLGFRPHPEAQAAQAPKSGKSGDSVFKLTCHSCRRGYSNYYSGYGAYYYGYGSYYPSYSYYAGYSSYYPSYYYAGYGSYSYYPSLSCYPSGCGGWSPCGCDGGW
jgi:hypothetical protein